MFDFGNCSAAVVFAMGAPQFAAQDPKVIFAQAQQSLAAGDYAGAQHGFQQVLAMIPNSVAANTNLGVAYLRAREYKSAIQAFNTSRRLAPFLGYQ